MTEPSLSAADLVGRLWDDAARRRQARAPTAVPELGPTTRMIHDPDLLYLTGHRDLDLADLLAHLIPLLSSMAERRDELTAELRLLREAMVAESERLEDRDDLMHRLLESRLDRMGRDDQEPW